MGFEVGVLGVGLGGGWLVGFLVGFVSVVCLFVFFFIGTVW